MGQLKGKTAIVTGAASGIGRATAQLFAAEGARVLAVDVNAAVAEISNEMISSLQCDLSNLDAPEKVLTAAHNMLGTDAQCLDILMNNAGVGSNAPADQMSNEEWDRVLNINLSAPFRLAQRAIPELRKSAAGRIINVASFSNEDIAAIWAKKSVLRRLGQPEDIAKVATFLASDASGFVTGQSINVDGGLLLRT